MSADREDELLKNADRLLVMAWDETNGTYESTSFATEAMANITLAAELRTRRWAEAAATQEDLS